MFCEKKGSAAVAWLKTESSRPYQDRYRLLSRDIPLVGGQDRGELFAIFDGIGGAPKAMEAAQQMCDSLLRFFREPETFPPTGNGVCQLLMESNSSIYNWGFIAGSNRPLGQCSGTVIWIYHGEAHVFHAGDTTALHIRGDEIKRLTHSHEMQGVTQRYFGQGPFLQFERNSCSLEELDWILLFTNGVTDVLSPEEAVGISYQQKDICRAVGELVRFSRTRGSRGDITAMLIEFEVED